MLKPVTVSSAAAIAKWNQSIPKYHRYHGTAVRVRTKVPIRNELVIQLIRSVGIRKITGKWDLSGHCECSSHRSASAARTLLKGPTENHVFFGPDMNTAAMRTGELLRFHFGRRPELFFYGASGIGQSWRRRTAHEQALEAGADFWFRPPRR